MSVAYSVAATTFTKVTFYPPFFGDCKNGSEKNQAFLEKKSLIGKKSYKSLFLFNKNIYIICPSQSVAPLVSWFTSIWLFSIKKLIQLLGIVSLTQTDKKGREGKEKLIEDVNMIDWSFLFFWRGIFMLIYRSNRFTNVLITMIICICIL